MVVRYMRVSDQACATEVGEHSKFRVELNEGTYLLSAETTMDNFGIHNVTIF